MVPEAMRAAWILKQDFGYETRVLNMHTMKPLDVDAIVRAARDTSVVLTVEEHQIGALAWPVASAISQSSALYGIPIITGAIGVKDRFGDSGAPWELIKEFEVSAEHIAAKAVELIGVKKSRSRELVSEVHLVGK
jgi:transketolase